MSVEKRCDGRGDIEDRLVETRDVKVLSTFFRCPGGGEPPEIKKVAVGGQKICQKNPG
jgi:hypothetical protein